MKDVKRYLEDREGKYGFVFEDISSGFVYKFNENMKVTSAGCMKLTVAIAFLKKIEEGKYNLDELIHISNDDKKPGSGYLKEMIERDYTIRELIILMLTAGDNTATFKLNTMLGDEYINKVINDMGMTHTNITLNPGSEENQTTAQDLANALKHLQNASYLTKEHSDFIIETLRQRGKSKIAFYLNKEQRKSIASKTGETEGVENEAALINTPDGNFVFTIVSDELPNSVYGIVSIAKAGMMIWNSLHSKF